MVLQSSQLQVKTTSSWEVQKHKSSGQSSADNASVVPPCKTLVQDKTKKIYLTEARLKTGVVKTTHNLI